MNAPLKGDQAMRLVIDEMRMGKHPAPSWEIEKQWWVIRTIETFMAPSRALVVEALAEHKALKNDAPTVPHQRLAVAGASAGVVAGG